MHQLLFHNPINEAVFMEFICIDIMNSNWQDHLGRSSGDRLDSPSWLKDLLNGYGINPGTSALEGLVPELRRLRKVMKDITYDIIEERKPCEASIELLNGYLGKTVHRHSIEPEGDGLKLLELPQGLDDEYILGEIALSFAELLTRHDTRRLKICRNPDCRWVFFDESKNRNKCWCESKTCGNLMKVRSYRERKRLER
jgi:predicted RNA-binding Zn ribbon-like protein